MRKDHVRQMGATPVLPVSLRGAMAGWLKAELKAEKNSIAFLVLAMTATARHKCRFDPRPASPTSWRELPCRRTFPCVPSCNGAEGSHTGGYLAANAMSPKKLENAAH